MRSTLGKALSDKNDSVYEIKQEGYASYSVFSEIDMLIDVITNTRELFDTLANRIGPITVPTPCSASGTGDPEEIQLSSRSELSDAIYNQRVRLAHLNQQISDLLCSITLK